MSDHARKTTSRLWKMSSRADDHERPSVVRIGDHARIEPVSTKSVVSIMIIPVLILSAVIGYSVQTVHAAPSDARSNTIDGIVVSSRSFSVDSVTNDYGVSRSMFREAISTDAGDGDWGGIEDIDIPYSRSTDQKTTVSALNSSVENGKSLYDSSGGMSTDEHRSALKALLDHAPSLTSNDKTSVKDLDGLRKKIDDAANTVQKDIEEARDQQYAAEVAAQAASSSSKTSVQSAPVQSMPVQSTPVQSTPSPNAGATKLPNGKTGKDVVDYAMQFVGRVPYIWAGSTPQGWDCSGYVLYVFSKFGISLPHYSGAQAQAGYAVASIASAKPGDIIANNTHAAIYIGNGRVVNALNPGAGTVVTPVQWAFSGGYQIRRLIG